MVFQVQLWTPDSEARAAAHVVGHSNHAWEWCWAEAFWTLARSLQAPSPAGGGSCSLLIYLAQVCGPSQECPFLICTKAPCKLEDFWDGRGTIMWGSAGQSQGFVLDSFKQKSDMIVLKFCFKDFYLFLDV